jgi:hypothetical protein
MSLKSYEFLPDEELTEDNLLQNKDFISDASIFLYDRTGEDVYEPQEVLDEFLHQMRFASANEISMYRDLEYAQNTSDEGKARFGRLMDAFDRGNYNVDAGTFGSYIAGGALSPSTIAGVGVGKLGSLGAQQVARQGLKKYLMGALTKPGVGAGAARAVAVEAPLAGVAEDVYQRTREEVGLDRQEGAVATATVAGGVLGGAIGGVAGYFGKEGAKKASKLAETAQKSVTKRKLVQQTVNREENEKLRKLSPELYEEGRRVFSTMNENTSLSAMLPVETIDSVITAVTRMASTIDRKEGQRVTEAVADAIIDGKITGEQFDSILAEHQLTKNQFAAVYVADISDAARKLGKQGQLKKVLNSLSDRGFLDLDASEIEEAARKPNKFFEFMRSLDRLRLGAMTSQLATTVRNTIGGGFRLATDMLENTFMEMSDVVYGGRSAKDAFKNITSTARYFFNQKEAAVIQEIFSDQMPKEARKLFFSAASAESRVRSDTLLGKIGNGINIANTISDSMFKRAIFASSLDRKLRKETGRSLNDVIMKGQFNAISDKSIRDSIDESLHFVYQQSPKIDTPLGEAGDLLIKLHRTLPFVVSSFIPFPRFIMNQMKFVYEHTPGLPMLMQGVNGKGLTQEALAKQMTGSVLITTATMFRAQQDPDTRWDEIKDSRGNTINMAATYGPMSPFMIMGDYIARAVRKDPIDSIEQYMRDTAQALGTPRFTGQFGWLPIDRLADDLADGKFARAAGKLTGDVLGTYTIPLAMVKDINSAYDKNARFVEDLDTILPATGDPWIDWFEYSVHYSQKYLPHWEDLKEGKLNYAVNPENRRYSVTAGRLERTSPIEKQLFGVTRYKQKTAFQSELDRLQIPRWQVFGRDPDPIRNALNSWVIGSILPDKMRSYILSGEYQSMDDTTRRDQLLVRARQFVSEDKVTEYVNGVMEDLEGTDKHFRYRHAFREEFEELTPARRRLLEKMWKADPLYNGMSINEAGAYHWAIETNDGLGKAIE